MLGTNIGHYRITRQLAQGGMGTVYEAIHQSIGHRAAVKVLSRDLATDPKHEDYVSRFFDEARAVNIAQHPGLLTIFDYGQTADGTIYIMMEFLAGESLRDRLRSLPAGSRLALADSLRAIRLIASALMAAHAKGILHRDLKPENVVMVADPDMPGQERTKLVDFGLARFVDSPARRTTAGIVLGTALYLSPEQCLGIEPLGPAADVYALGVMFYELLSGRPPFAPLAQGGEYASIMKQHVSVAPAPLSGLTKDVPAAVCALVHQMLEKDPAARPSLPMVILQITEVEGKGAAAPAENGVARVPDSARGSGSAQNAKTSRVAVARQPSPSQIMLGAVVGSAITAVVLAAVYQFVLRP